MDMNDFIFRGTKETNVISPEQQTALAASLRNRDNMGAIMALSGDRVVAPVGQQFQKDVSTQRQQGITNRYYQGMLEGNTEDRASRERIAAMNNRTRMAQIGSNERVRGNLNEKPWSPKQQDQMRYSLGILDSLNELKGSYKKEWESSIPGMGVFKKYAARVAPNATKALMGQGAIDFKAWFDDLDRSVEVIIKNKLFGSALTAAEIKTWKTLTIDPAANMQQIEAWYNRVIPKIEADLARQVRSTSVLYPRQVGALLGNPDPGQEDVGPDPEMYDVEDLE